jgi:hypothetical protein
VGPRAVLDAVVKRKIPSLESRSSSPYPSAIPTELSRLLVYIYSSTYLKVKGKVVPVLN